VAGTSSSFSYSYDPLGRLLTVTKDGSPVEEYRYDNNGNRSYQMNSYLNIVGRTFSHSVEDHTLTAGPVTYEFDYDDNLSARIEGEETTRYSYSTTGELMEVTLPDGRVVSYVHDPLGRRIAKKINGSTVEKYLWSGMTTLLAVYDGYDNLRQRFDYADGRLPVAMKAGGSTYYLAYDQVGSLRLVTDSSGGIVKRIDYDSFGNILSDSDSSFTIPFGFAGGLHDRDTGLVRFGYRDYLPEIGKWTAKDPIDFAGGDSNLYGYVQNDPVNWVDPWGLSKSSNPFKSTDPLVQDLKKAIPKGQDSQAFKDAMKAIRGQLDEVSTSRARKDILRAALKVGKAPAKYAAKYGIKLVGGAALVILESIMFVDEVSADEWADYAMYLIDQEIERMENENQCE
jgi:RHS repeat-associated protein